MRLTPPRQPTPMTDRTLVVAALFALAPLTAAYAVTNPRLVAAVAATLAAVAAAVALAARLRPARICLPQTDVCLRVERR